MAWLEHRVPPPLWALIFAVTMGILAYFTAPLFVAPGIRIFGGLALAALGGAVAVSGALRFRRSGASIDPIDIERGEILVTSGIFRYTRNPMYLGLTVVLSGLAFYLARPVELAPLFLFVLLITRMQILPEERAMLAKFGAAYAEYSRATRRWI